MNEKNILKQRAINAFHEKKKEKERIEEEAQNQGSKPNAFAITSMPFQGR